MRRQELQKKTPDDGTEDVAEPGRGRQADRYLGGLRLGSGHDRLERFGRSGDEGQWP